MSKRPKFRIKKDENGDLHVFLVAGNGREMFRSTDALFKVGNGIRTVERIRAAVAEAQIEEDD